MASQFVRYDGDGQQEPNKVGGTLPSTYYDAGLLAVAVVDHQMDDDDRLDNDLRNDLLDLDDDAWERVKQDFGALLPRYRRLWAPLHRRAIDQGACATCGHHEQQEGCHRPPAGGGGATTTPQPPPPPYPVGGGPSAALALEPKDEYGGDRCDFRDLLPPQPATPTTAVVVVHPREEPWGSGSTEATSEGSPPGVKSPNKNRPPMTSPSSSAPMPEPDRSRCGTSSSSGDDETFGIRNDTSAPSSPASAAASTSSASSGDSTVLRFDHISFEPSPTAVGTAPLHGRNSCRNSASSSHGGTVNGGSAGSHMEIAEGTLITHATAAAVSTPPTLPDDGSIFVVARSSASPPEANAKGTPELRPLRQQQLGSLDCPTPYVTVRKKHRNRRRVSTPPEEGWACENFPLPGDTWDVGYSPRGAPPPGSPIQGVAYGGADGGGEDEDGGNVLDEAGTVLDNNDDGGNSFRNRSTVPEGPRRGSVDSDMSPVSLAAPQYGTPLLQEGSKATDSVEEGCSPLDREAATIATTDGIVCSSSPSGVVVAIDDSAASAHSSDEEDERPSFGGAIRSMRRPVLDVWDSDAESPDERSMSSENAGSAGLDHQQEAEATRAQWRDLADTSSEEDEGGTPGPSTVATTPAHRMSLACISPKMAVDLDASEDESESDAGDRKPESNEPDHWQSDSDDLDDASASADSGFDVSELIHRTKVIVLDSDNSEPDDSSEDSVVEVEKPAKAPPTAKGGQSTKARTRATITSKSSQLTFVRRRQALSQTLFREFDRQAFDGVLIRSGRCTVEWSKKLRSTAGLTRLKGTKSLPGGTGGNGQRTMSATSRHEAVIELSLKVLDCEERLRNTLVHEMCHAVAWLVDGNSQPPHGPIFHKWADRAMRLLPDVQVTTTHTYEIAFKYAWQCQTPSCRALVQRHSRSVDVQRQCCGSCHGGQLVLVRGGRQLDTAAGRDRPPPKPSDYQLFVREHGPSVRQQLKSQGVSASQSDVFAACAVLWQERKAEAAAAAATDHASQRTHDG